MSKPFDYSKWDNIELSDDEDDVHPNIDRESWFRMKHRSRVEREDNEDKDKTRITQEMEKANQRIKVLQHELSKLDVQKKQAADDSDSDDDDLDDREGLQAELKELQTQNAARQSKLEEYEKNKKWNVDNMFQVKEERTIVNPAAAETNYTETGFVRPKDEDIEKAKPADTKPKAEAKKSAASKPAAAAKETKKPTSSKPAPASKKKVGPAAPPAPAAAPKRPPEDSAMDSYPEFTNKYADKVEEFMAIPDLEGSKNFLLQHADILLQENASNYLLLASLEDEMNGYRDKMKRTARQSQIISHIAELAKTMKTHPGNVIMPFFVRLGQREHLEEFLAACDDFQKKIIARAVVKKREIDAARAAEAAAAGDDEDAPTDLADIPREQRLGPGGLDPLEVIETLPKEMVEAFESREIQKLHDALSKMDPKDAEYHMKRCVDSGLWVANK